MFTPLSRAIPDTATRNISQRRSGATAYRQSASGGFARVLGDTSGRAARANSSSQRQTSVTSTPAALFSQPATEPAATAAATKVQAATAQAPSAVATDAATLLKNALLVAGIDPSGIEMSAHDNLITYPGTSWVHRMLTVKIGSKTETLGADLVEKWPEIAVGDIKRLLQA